jgi:NDP-sugar pyrophosphorylase family protein
MQVDYVLVLAAGKGTRMGDIGKEIPKVLWPVFNKTILELEVLYAKQYCKNKIFVNLYNYKDKLQEYIQNTPSFQYVEQLVETEVLDIGGAIHNLAAKVGYKGKLLVLNSDQFIMLSQERWKNFYELSNKKDVVILTYDVYGRDLYNATIIENEKLVEVRKNEKMPRDEKHETYTGMSIINLESLKEIKGKSKFFESVADYKNLDVGGLNIYESQYWDFGTIRRYYNSCFDIIKKWKSDDPFINFLKKNNVLNPELIRKNSYNSKKKFVIDLSYNTNHVEKTIYMGKSDTKIPECDCIVHGKLIELVDLPSL